MTNRLRHWLHPQQRPLTAAEIRMAQSIFTDQLDYAAVRILAARWVLPRFAISPNGHVYFNPADWRTDFGDADLSTRSWLIHELVHVWQYQRGMAVVRRALLNRRYRYALETGRDFLSYGIEQQAQLVQDYYIRRELEADCQAWEQCLLPYFGQLGLSEKSATSAS